LLAHVTANSKRPNGSSAAAGSEQEPWEPPLPLGRETPVPSFPTDVLPGWLRDWVEAEAEATQTPPDLAGMLGLAVCAAGLAGRVRVIVRPGWSEPTNIFTTTVLPSGERKTAVLRDALAPVQELERQAQDRERPIIASAASEHRVLEQRLKRAEQTAAKAKG